MGERAPEDTSQMAEVRRDQSYFRRKVSALALTMLCLSPLSASSPGLVGKHEPVLRNADPGSVPDLLPKLAALAHLAPVLGKGQSNERMIPALVPFGIPESYTIKMQQGGTRTVQLTKMSCDQPKVCRITSVEGQPGVAMRQIVPPEPDDINDHTNPLWKPVYYFDQDPRLVMGHTTHLPQYGNYFGGQTFNLIKVGDPLVLDTSTSVRTYTAIQTVLTPKDTSNGQYAWNQMKENLHADQLLFTSCSTGANVDIVFQEESAKPL